MEETCLIELFAKLEGQAMVYKKGGGITPSPMSGIAAIA